jgi:hypothetical protein
VLEARLRAVFASTLDALEHITPGSQPGGNSI